MPNKGAKFSSEYLSSEQMKLALLALPSVLLVLLGERRIIDVLASYGWNANIHNDLRYKPMRGGIQYLIEDSIEQHIIVPGASDFRFELPEGRLDILFCHESDIHLDGLDDALLHEFMMTDPFSQIIWHTQEDVAKMML